MKEFNIKHKTLIIGLIVVGVVAFIWYYTRKKDVTVRQFMGLPPKQTDDEKQVPSQVNINVNEYTPPKPIVKPGATTAPGFPLRYGSNNVYVQAVQIMLNKKNNAKLKTDGILGPKTQSAVKKAGFGTSIDMKEFYTICDIK